MYENFLYLLVINPIVPPINFNMPTPIIINAIPDNDCDILNSEF